MSAHLILVDENDSPCGQMEKLLVHRLGLLHRAFSVFIFNTQGELLLQQRAECKYHSGGLWSNACCSHPVVNEIISQTINRRLQEEMGMQCETNFAYKFMYKVDFENGLTEYEYDHIYIGVSDNTPYPSASEVKSWKYITLDELKLQIDLYPQQYTEWMKICLPIVVDHYNNYLAEAGKDRLPLRQYKRTA